MKSALEKAIAAFQKGKYAEVTAILEPMVVHYRDSFRFYYLLGLSCLYSGDLGGSATYLKRADQLKAGDTDVELAMAALHLRKRDIKSALESYLDIVDEHPKNREAAKALDFLRKNGEEGKIAELVDTGEIRKFYPRIRKAFPWLALALSFLGCAAIVATIWFAYLAISNRPAARPLLNDIRLELSERQNPAGGNQSALLILTEKQILEGFDRAKKYLEEYRDNAAIREANAILQSNASEFIKSKTRRLLGIVEEPGFQDIRDIPEFAQLMEEPRLYEGMFVRWKGRVANYRSTESSCDFDFLVGYQDKKTLLGIIPAIFGKDMGLDPDHPIELLGRIKIVQSGPVIEGIAIHDLSYGSKD
jgi:hypothetical protein